MTGGNVTIAQLPTQAVMATGDSVPAWSATGQSTYQAYASMIADVVGTIPLIWSNQTTATAANSGAVTLASSPVGYIEIQINGNLRKIPYYAS